MLKELRAQIPKLSWNNDKNTHKTHSLKTQNNLPCAIVRISNQTKFITNALCHTVNTSKYILHCDSTVKTQTL